MKNIFKFAAMAFAAVVLAGVATSCEPDQEEPKHPLDGKVLKIADEDMGDIYIDLGAYMPGNIVMGMSMGDDNIYAMNMLGSFTITPTDDKSGIITRSMEDPYSETGVVTQEIPYSDLTETSCSISTNFLGKDKIVTAEIVNVTLVDPNSGQ